MWALVFIEIVIGTSRFDLYSDVKGVYDDMSSCFYARDTFLPIDSEFPKPNQQFVCVRIEDFTNKD